MKSETCTKCKIKLPATAQFFHRDKSTKSGLRSQCKRCCVKYQKEYQCTIRGKVVHNQAARKYQTTINGHLRQIYKDIKRRCNNLHCKDYKNYGGRGVQNKFKSPDEFVNYIINELKVDPRGLQIDRIDNDGDYKRGNIRFVTCSENLKNKRGKK